MLVKLIVSPNINWTEWINTFHYATGKSPVKSLDDSNKSKRTDSDFIESLGYISETIKPLKHLSYSFMVQCDPKHVLTILRDTDLAVNNDEDILILSGNVLQWRGAIASLTEQSRPMDLRFIFDAIYLYFRELGFGNIFINRKDLPDKTFTLEL